MRQTPPQGDTKNKKIATIFSPPGPRKIGSVLYLSPQIPDGFLTKMHGPYKNIIPIYETTSHIIIVDLAKDPSEERIFGKIHYGFRTRLAMMIGQLTLVAQLQE